MNIDIIKFSNEDVVSYITTLMSYGYLPYITIPSRITNSSMTCIRNSFVRLSRREKMLSIICGLFHCDIVDHLPNFISIKHNMTCCKDERPMSSWFGEKNTASYGQRMGAENWNDIYTGNGDYYSQIITVVLRIYQQSFPIVRVSRKRWQDEPLMTKALKTSIKRKNYLYKLVLFSLAIHYIRNTRHIKNVLRKCLKEAEINYYEEWFDNHKNSVYNLWKTLNPIIYPKRGKCFSPVNKLIIGRKAIIDKQEISNSMNEHFCNIGNELQSEMPDYGNKYRDYMPHE